MAKMEEITRAKGQLSAPHMFQMWEQGWRMEYWQGGLPKASYMCVCVYLLWGLMYVR